MTIRDLLAQGMRTLEMAGQSSARLDAQVLLEHVLEVERTILYAYPEREVTAAQAERFWQFIARRKQGEPVAYLVGHKEFYGLDFQVDQRVLIPRPETELLVESALLAIRSKLSSGHIPIVADIGTGSGAIPVTIVVEEPRLPYLYASDLSEAALEVARLNCLQHHVESRVRLLQGDLLAPLPESVDILTANLPYVGTNETLAPDVKNYEPHLALFSGDAGLDLVQRLCQEAFRVLKTEAVMFLEIGYLQREPVTHLLRELWPLATITYKKDYAGWDRLIQLSL